MKSCAIADAKIGETYYTAQGKSVKVTGENSLYVFATGQEIIVGPEYKLFPIPPAKVSVWHTVPRPEELQEPISAPEPVRVEVSMYQEKLNYIEARPIGYEPFTSYQY